MMKQLKGFHEAFHFISLRMLEVKSNNATVCCEGAAEDMADVGVRSAGFADGNEARAPPRS